MEVVLEVQKKILVRAPNWAGDAVVSTVFLSRLKTLHPYDSITVLCPPYLTRFYEAHGVVQEVIALPYKNGVSVFGVGRLLRQKKFDEMVVLPRSFRTGLESWLSRIPIRVGFGGDLRRLFFTKTVPYEAGVKYPARYLAFIGETEKNLPETPPFFPRTGDPKATFKNLGLDFSTIRKPILGIAPKSVAPARTWAADRYAEVAHQFLSQTNGSVFLFGIESERDVTSKVKNAVSGEVYDFTGKLTWPEKTLEMGDVIGSCDVFLCNDSGLMHVAAALKVKTVVIFGASDPKTALPVGSHVHAIQKSDLWCVPCGRNFCVRFGDNKNECLKSVTVEDVVQFLI